jgi:hypothetical protein
MWIKNPNSESAMVKPSRFLVCRLKVLIEFLSKLESFASLYKYDLTKPNGQYNLK